MSRFNLDAIAGQAPSQQVQQAAQQARLLAWGDPSSLHFEGKQAANLLEVSRDTVAKELRVPRSHISFQSSTPEAVRAAFSAINPGAILYSPIERKVVIDEIAGFGVPAEALAVDLDGRVEPHELAEQLALTQQTIQLTSAATNRPIAVFVQWANQEIGTVQHLVDLGKQVHESGGVLVVDATAALGYLPAVTVDSSWDYLLADSASWGGSRVATVLGSATPTGFADTTSVADAATAAVSLEYLLRDQPRQSELLTGMRHTFEQTLTEQFKDIDLIQPQGLRLPQVVSFSIPYVDAEALAVELDRNGVAIGSGSACASEVGVPSHVLTAIGRLTQGNVRISLPIDCHDDAIARLNELLPDAVAELTTDIDTPTATVSGAGYPAGQPGEVIAELDERGQLCPHPVIELAKTAKTLSSGAIIGITTDDPAALNDIPAWARLQSATVISQESIGSRATRFVVQLS